MSRTNKTRHIKWHESWKWICRLDPIICNNKQRRNEDKCKFECKGLTDKGVCDKGYFLILVTVNASVINLVVLVNI